LAIWTSGGFCPSLVQTDVQEDEDAEQRDGDGPADSAFLKWMMDRGGLVVANVLGRDETCCVTYVEGVEHRSPGQRA
jgi:hypothetical protein